MNKTHLLTSAMAVAVALSGCSTPPEEKSAAQDRYAVIAPDVCCQPVEEKERAEPQPVQQVAPMPVQQPAMMPMHQQQIKKPKSELLKITGIGYGAESTYAGYTPGQRRLMAIRSSKLDAYRALAEQIAGIKIDSNTSVATLTAKNDSFRARVNAVVRGARVVSVTPMADSNYETVLEVYVDKAFFEKAFVYTEEDEQIAVDPDSMYRFRTLR